MTKLLTPLISMLLCSIAAADTLDLAGTWSFRLDPDDAGVREAWFDTALPDSLELPGACQAQGFGNDVSVETPWIGTFQNSPWYSAERYAPYRQPGNIKFPYCLQPDKHYVGPAWYQRTVDVPAAWAGKRVTLLLERPHWYTDVWVDGTKVAHGESLSIAHRYDLTDALTPGRHTLTIRIDNGLVINVGPNSHSVSDHTQSAWNGIAGRIALETSDPVWIENIKVYPDLQAQTARVRVRMASRLDNPVNVTLKLNATSYNSDKAHSPAPVDARGAIPARSSQSLDLTLALGRDAQLWDEFHPALYRLAANLETADGRYSHTRETSFGMREVATAGTNVTINGRPIYLRGTLECAIFPKTGYPPTDVDSWKRIIRICQDHGLNHMRFHSWCPPEAAFIAADELGFYFHVEASTWANQGASVGDGDPFDAWLIAEADRILNTLGNHPSFIMFAYGNEPAGDNQKQFLGQLVQSWKQNDPRRIYTSGAAWPLIPENQFHSTPDPRIQRWGEGLTSRINGQPPATTADYRDFVARYPDTPVVAHEIGQWCVYPDFDEMSKYTGYLKPKNFEIFRDFLHNNHMGDQERDFLMASGKLQVICYKEDIESALRTPGFGGFQLLDLHDFPGQGTALVGVLDPFWDEKPYCSAEEYSRFCNSTVPLVRLPRRTFTTRDALTGRVELSHFGPADLTNARLNWRLTDEQGRSHAAGVLSALLIPTGRLSVIGDIRADLAAVPAPSKLTLTIALENTDFENSWDIWVYPANLPQQTPDDVLVVSELDYDARQALEQGRKVLLTIPTRSVKSNVALGFSPVFWNTAWTKNQAPHTLGILCDPKHPLFAHFPTSYHTDWQWWEIVSNAQPMVLDELPADLRPLVQPIHTWFETKRLGLVLEARVGQGKLLVTSIDLNAGDKLTPALRQFRYSLLQYMASEAFNPQAALDPGLIEEHLTRGPNLLRKLGAEFSASSFHPGNEPWRVADDDPATIWHSSWNDPAPDLPHELTIELRQAARIEGVTLTPRQDMPNGRIKGFELYTAQGDGFWEWGNPIATGRLDRTAAPKSIRFSARLVQRIRLRVLSNHSNNPYASLAELNLIPAE